MRAAGDGMTMAQVRAAIDRVDAALVALLAERASWIDQAAEVKAREGLPARINWRVEEVVANVRGHAEAQGLPPALVEMLWRELIGWSIAREEARLGPDDDMRPIGAATISRADMPHAARPPDRKDTTT
jgi:isochorismate pyruvate lyase